MRKQIPVLLLIAASFLIYYCSDSGTNPVSEKGEIKIGALIPFTGSYGQQGDAVLTALQLAVEDANAYFTTQGISKQVSLVYYDTETDPVVANAMLKSLIRQDIRIIVGPMTSAEILGVKETIDTSNAVIISQSSTSTELSIANDNIFRIVPDDTEMAKAISTAVWEQDVRKLLLFYRDDSWGNGLAEMVRNEFEAKGGDVICETNYYSFRTSSYQESLDEMTACITPLLVSNDTSAFGVHLSCFDEGTDILELAEDEQILSKIKWFGSDGIAQNNYLLEVERAVGFARNVDFSAPIFGIDASEDYTILAERLSNQLGYSPNAYILLSYDALRAAALILAGMEESEGINVLKERLINTLHDYNGVTGTIELNDAGDRSNGTYFFWKLNDSGMPAWEVGYKYTGGNIIY